MLELPKIRSSDFEDTLERLMRRFPAPAGEQEQELSESSMELTLLELLTYTLLLQRENMNKISADALFALGRLYGSEPLTNVPATGFAEIRGSGCLPALSKLHSDNRVFETLEDRVLSGNKAVFFGRENDGRLMPYMFNDVSIEVFSDSDVFVIGFSEPLEHGKENCVYIRFDERGRRLPDNMESFVTGTECVWEYYGNEGGRTGWHELGVSSDGTYSCFRSGALIFTMRGEHGKTANVYPIRARLVKRGFDIYPLFTGAYAGACPIAQQDTRCTEIVFGIREFSENAMYFSCALAESRVYRLLINTENGYADSGSLDVDFDVDIDRDSGRMRLVTSARTRLIELFGRLPNTEKNSVMMLVLYSEELVRDFCTVSVNSAADQKVELNFSGIIPQKTRILVSREINGTLYYQRRDYTDRLCLHSGRDRVFSCTGTSLSFGDDEHGAVPCDQNAEVLITSLCLTDGADGGLPIGTLSADRDDISAERISPLSGGYSEESAGGFFARAVSEKKARTLVTVGDFEERARNVKGLLIKRTKAFAGDAANTVVITVEPDVKDPRSACAALGWYLENIYAELKRLCPITTALEVKFPEYVPLDVRISFSSANLFGSAEAIARDILERALDEDDIERADHAELYRKLESAGRIASLTLSSESRHARMTGDGSVEFPAHARPYLNKLQITGI